MPQILVVDDTPVDRRLAGGLIEQDPSNNVSYAENGADAIKQLSESVPDLVLTDLQMPEMDGLQLVETIRMTHPQLPVILMTAQGSETIAIDALDRGASSHVPKSQLNEKLLPTVEEVLSVAGIEQTYANLIACQDRIEMSYTLKNDTDLVVAVTEFIQQFLEGMDLLDHTDNCRVVIALREALLNGLFHGNLEISPSDDSSNALDAANARLNLIEERRNQKPYCDRKLFLDFQIDREEARFVIRDEGNGFDHAAILASTSPKTSGMEKGRGLRLILSFMDEVSFNDAGNELTIVKLRHHIIE